MIGECHLCGMWCNLERHHVFGAANRKHSEKWGMVVDLCPTCHRTGRRSVHQSRETADRLKAEYQSLFESVHGHDEFMKIFGRNYL